MIKSKIGHILFLLWLLSYNVSAQENFLDGTVVTNKGDTLRGQIDFQGWDRNPSSITFRREDVINKYFPTQIKWFAVSDVQYISAILPIEQYSLQVKNMTTETSPQASRDTVFLEQLVSGTANLYYLNDRNSISHFFYQTQGQEIKELSNYQYIKITDEGKKVALNPKRYLGSLNLLMKDCIEISSESVDYSVREMKDLFRRYNQCKAPSTSFVATDRRRLLFEPGIILGGSLTAFSLEEGGADEPTKASPSIDASFGLALNIVLPTSNRRWSVNNELTYRAYSPSTETDEIVNGFNATTSYYFEVVAIKLTNAIRYQVPAKSIRPFFNLGIFNSLALKNDNKRTQVVYLNTEVRTTETSPAITTRDHEIGFLVGVGMAYKRFLIEARYEKGNGLSNAVGYGTTINTLYLLLTYRLTKAKSG